jgi:hypothetical protein
LSFRLYDALALHRMAMLCGNILQPNHTFPSALQVDCGDGTTEKFPLAAGTASFDETHAYAVLGTFTVTVTLVIGTGGGQGTRTVLVGSLHQRFVSQLYTDLLGRLVSPPELAAWAWLLDHGVPRAFIVTDIENSSEHRGRLVQDVYAQFLGRSAQQTEVVGWLLFLSGGGTLGQMKALVLGSDEYVVRRGGGSMDGFLQAVYGDVLHRTAASVEIHAWEATRVTANARGTIATAILDSPEADLLQAADLFPQFLRRPSTPAERQEFTLAFEDGLITEQAVALVLASDEYLGRL